MSMKPILFNTEMVRAILDGRKTVTRRIVKPQPKTTTQYPLGFCGSSTDRKMEGCFVFGLDEYGGSISYAKPLCKVGDILYVRETQSIYRVNDKDNKFVRVHYKADNSAMDFKVSDSEWCRLVKYDYTDEQFISPYWTTKETCRLFLKVTNVRVERLRYITEEQALKEGFIGIPCTHENAGEHGCTDCMNTGWLEPPQLEFMYTWDSTIKKADLNKYGWLANPYVFVIEFERCEKPEGWCK